MEVILAVTRSCHHCAILEKELKRLHVPYCVRYYEERPEIIEKYGLKRSPVVIVDDEVVFNGMPSISDLEKYFKEKQQEGGDDG
ncbi:MAG: thioredoxin family protein [Desulfobulbaceae bacterium]|nr:thioredoxin family protein [Desulfobulbaceae bacterium]